MDFTTDPELQKILADNKSGSVELLLKLNNYLSKNIFSRSNYNDLLKFLKKSFASFANIQNYLDELRKVISSENQNNIISFFGEFENRKELIIKNIYNNCVSSLKNHNSFLTISNSSTILKILELLKKETSNLSITVCESRPVNEGQIMVQELNKIDIEVKLITEAMIASEIQKVDAAIIGADNVLPNGNVINKVGSNLIAIACKHYAKPFYVIADKSKSSSTGKFHEKEKPASEIWKNKPANMKIKNYYFEEIKKSLITKIITD